MMRFIHLALIAWLIAIGTSGTLSASALNGNQQWCSPSVAASEDTKTEEEIVVVEEEEEPDCD